MIDALAYLDEEIDFPGMRDAVDALILEEMKSFKPKNYLAHLPKVDFSFKDSVFLKNEFNRLSYQKEMPPINVDKYKVLPPSNENDIDEVISSVENAKAQLSHMECRTLNLELLQKYGPSYWREHIKETQVLCDQLQVKTNQLRKEIEDENLVRKSMQLENAPKLKTLTRKWGEMVHKNNVIQQACDNLEREVKRLKVEAQNKGIDISHLTDVTME